MEVAFGGWGWKGVAGGDTLWSNDSNWNKATSGPNGYYFRNSLESFTGYSVSFDRVESLGSNTFYVDNGTSADHPIVFSSAESANGFTLNGNMRVGSLTSEQGHARFESGTYTVNRLLLGEGTNAVSSVIVKNATITAKEYLCVGMDKGGDEANSYFELDGGTVTTTSTSGSANQYGIIIGDAGLLGQVARICVKSGTMSSAKFISVGRNGAGVFDMEGGNVSAPKVWLVEDYGCGSGEDCFLNLKGGTLATAEMTYGKGGAKATVTLDGGTLQATAAGTFMAAKGNLYVKVGANGGTVDANGCAITIAENLESAVSDDPETADVVEKDGGLRFTGGAEVSLTGSVSYNGKTTLDLGTTLLVANAAAKTKILANGIDVVVPSGVTVVPGMPVLTLTASSGTISAAELAGCTLPAAYSDNFGFGLSSDGKSVVTVAKCVWNDGPSAASWLGEGKWNVSGSPGTWADGSLAIFAAEGDAATVDSDVTAIGVTFDADATVSGTSSLTVSAIAVASGVEATVSAPTAGAMEKTGQGKLTLASSRTALTTVSEGTLAMAPGATVDSAKLKLGSSSTKSVTFDYGGQTLTGARSAYVVPGSRVTLENGVYAYTEKELLLDNSFASVFTIESTAVVSNSNRYVINPERAASNMTVNVKGGLLVSTGAKTTDGSGNNYMMNSGAGKLDINVTDGGRIEVKGRIYAMSCHENNAVVEGSNPRFNWVFDNASMLVDLYGLYIGRYDTRTVDGAHLPTTPEFRLSVTNSNISSVDSILIGEAASKNPAEGGKHGGYHIAEFDDSIVTTKHFYVFSDRLNSAHFNGSRLVLPSSNDEWLYADSDYESKWSAHSVTVGAKGFELATQGFNGKLGADLGGTGPVSKTGSGMLTIAVSQTQAGAGAFTVSEGVLTFANGVGVARPVVVAEGAKLRLPGRGNVLSGGLTLSAGATVDVYSPNSVTAAVTVASLVLPESGTVALTKNGGSFSKGLYPILSMQGVSLDITDKFAPSTGDLPYSFFLQGDCLCLAVNTTVGDCRIWVGSAGDGKLSTPGNWLGASVPPAGETLDFSHLSNNATIDADIQDAVFATLSMGSKAVTFTGSLTVETMTNVQHVAVGPGGVVTVKGDVVLTGTSSEAKYIAYRVDAGGMFVVEGRAIAGSEGQCQVMPSSKPSEGLIAVGGLLNDSASSDLMYYRLVNNANSTNRWAIGEHGIDATGNRGYFMMYLDVPNFYRAEVQPIDGDFQIKAWIGVRLSDTLVLDTTGLDGLGHTIEVTSQGGIIRDGALVVSGTGTVLYGCDVTQNPYNTDRKVSVEVEDGATLALKPGANLGSGKTTVNSGGTLKVAESGTAALHGALDLNDGAVLAFNFSTAGQTPMLNLSGRTVTFEEGASTNVAVRISAARGTMPGVGDVVLTSGGKFADATPTLASGAPKWARSVSVKNGELVLRVMPPGMFLIVH
ncbi:MAG: hypothetical protein IKQ17_09990 [Kiritimatiellae bacterium]|nr:hypothetical protein [Kiritimatiellia bacterium]